MRNSRVNICKGFLFLAVFSILMYSINFAFSWIHTFSFTVMLIFTVPFAVICFLCFVAHDIVADFVAPKKTKTLKVANRRVIIDCSYDNEQMYFDNRYHGYKKAC